MKPKSTSPIIRLTAGQKRAVKITISKRKPKRLKNWAVLQPGSVFCMSYNLAQVNIFNIHDKAIYLKP